MNNKRILLVDDSLSMLTVIKDKLEKEGYNVTTADNGRTALDIFSKNPFPVVISDIEMPEMDGNEFVDCLNKFPSPPVILVVTSFRKPSVIINMMKKGVYDYLLKPADIESLPIKVKKAFESAEMKINLDILEKERTIRLEEQLNWYRWSEKKKNEDEHDKKGFNKSFYNRLQTVFNQGGGFGSLVSVVDILISSAKKEDKFYLIDAELIDLLKENSDKAQRGLSVVRDIDKIAHDDLKTESIGFNDCYEFINQIVNESNSIADKKNQRIILNEIKEQHEDGVIDVNKEYLKSAFYEILLNACKFSEKDSNILVFVDVQDDSIIINTVNIPIDNKDGVNGIPMGYEHIIFEPFFRLTKNVHEEYNTLDYGLGLTKVENIVKKHNGKVEISNITNNTNQPEGFKAKVNVSLSLPIHAG